MNKKQKIVLGVGIVIVVLMGLFPPVHDGDYVENDFFLFADGVVLLSNLFLQWFMVSIIAGGLIITFKDKKPKNEQKQ